MMNVILKVTIFQTAAHKNAKRGMGSKSRAHGPHELTSRPSGREMPLCLKHCPWTTCRRGPGLYSSLWQSKQVRTAGEGLL